MFTRQNTAFHSDNAKYIRAGHCEDSTSAVDAKCNQLLLRPDHTWRERMLILNDDGNGRNASHLQLSPSLSISQDMMECMQAVNINKKIFVVKNIHLVPSNESGGNKQFIQQEANQVLKWCISDPFQEEKTSKSSK